MQSENSKIPYTAFWSTSIRLNRNAKTAKRGTAAEIITTLKLQNYTSPVHWFTRLMAYNREYTEGYILIKAVIVHVHCQRVIHYTLSVQNSLNTHTQSPSNR